MSLSDQHLEKKFQGVTNTQDSIQTLSLWLLHHKAHHQKIVTAWMKVLQKGKINHRLAMFYLANDVIQNSKRKGFLMFVNSFAEVLKDATLLVRDEKIRHSIQRVFNIWEERSVYTHEFIVDLTAILSNSKVPASAPAKLLAGFKSDTLVKKLRSLLKMEVDSTSKLSTVNFNKLNATDAEIIQQLKDRVHGQQFKQDFDKNLKSLEELIDTKNKEIEERTELILLLEQGEIYYDTQRGEAKVVSNAYKNFDGRIKTLQKKLEEMYAAFSSPVPSPCPDAPSPTTSDHDLELKLPNENVQTIEMENLEDAPSPEGSPEGLNLSPEPKRQESNSQTAAAKPVGNPIPTLSNFFNNEEGGKMTSWLGAFASKKAKESTLTPTTKSEAKKSDPSSLDSRLSNLLQNIPSLPSGLPSSLFGGASSASSTPAQSAPSPTKKKAPEAPPGTLTPLKDDCSGQNTPLQDEDSHPFLNKLATTSSKTQAPKDILKGLTTLIQSAAGDNNESTKKEKYSTFSSAKLYEQSGEMSTFIKSTIPHASSSSTYFTSSQSMSTPIGTLAAGTTTAAPSYQTTTFNNVSSYSTKSSMSEGSYIQSVLPSTLNDSFDFPKDSFSEDEYNPELELFNTDMDLVDVDSEDDIPSPAIEPLSPVSGARDNDERPRNAVPGRRLSTLITVVAGDSPVADTTPKKQLPSDELYKNKNENVTQELGPPWNTNNQPWGTNTTVDPTNHPWVANPQIDTNNQPWDSNSIIAANNQTWDTNTTVANNLPWAANTAANTINQPVYSTAPVPEPVYSTAPLSEPVYSTAPLPDPVMKDPHNEEFFTGKIEPSVPSYFSAPMPQPANGENVKYQRGVRPGDQLVRIETVQSHRNEDQKGGWFGNNGQTFPDGPPRQFNRLPQEEFFDHDRNFPQPSFHPRPNWMPRNRPDMLFDDSFQQKRNHSFSHRPYGPSPNKRFPLQGRGWGKPQY